MWLLLFGVWPEFGGHEKTPAGVAPAGVVMIEISFPLRRDAARWAYYDDYQYDYDNRD
jgi:hypothetical protein